MKTLPSAIALVALALVGQARAAVPIVLYETGWETPDWTPGTVVPQNGWQGFNSSFGHTVVANGTPNAVVNGETIATPFGDQFHRFTASPSTTTIFDRAAWVDLGPQFNARPAGYNFLIGSIDVFVPHVQSADQSFYGLAGYNAGSPNFGVLINPVDGSLNLLLDSQFSTFVPNVITFDTWLHVSVTANFESGEVVALLNGTDIGLHGTAISIIGGGFTDLDLVAENGLGGPTVRSIFSDNYRVELNVVPVPEPGVLTLLAGVPLAWSLRWLRRRHATAKLSSVKK